MAFSNTPYNFLRRVVNTRRQWLLLGLIIFVALALRIWGIGFGLPHRYHIDEPAYVLAALNIARGNLHITYPYNSPNLFQITLALEYGLLFMGGLLTGHFNSAADLARMYQTDPSVFFLLGRATSAILGSVAVALTYLLGKRLEGQSVGLLAALILAFSFAPARDAHFATPDTLITTLVVGAVLMTVSYAHSGNSFAMMISSLLAGAAVGLKYIPAPVFIPLTIIIFWHWISQDQRKIRFILLNGISAAIMAIVGFLSAFPAIIIDPGLFSIHWQNVWHQASYALGDFMVDPAPAWLFYGKVLVWGMGWSICLVSIVGFVLAFREEHHQRGWWIILLFMLLYYITISLLQTQFARYALPLMPFAALLAALVVVRFYKLVLQRIRLRWPIQAFFGILVVIIICIEPATALIRQNVLLNRTDTRTLAKEWIESHIPAGTEIAVQWYGPPLASAQDPEPDSIRTYSLTVLSPFTRHMADYELTTYTESEIRYIVVNSWNGEFVSKDGQQNLIRQHFYQDLQANAKLVMTFSPLTDQMISHPFFWEQIYGPATELWRIQRPGPTIKVYELGEPNNE